MLSEEIINHEFSRTFKGYDIEQVEDYIENLISMYEQLANENKEISARFEQLAASFEENKKKFEDADNALKEAAEEKERIIAEANAEREKILSNAEDEALAIKQEANIKATECVESAEGMARRLLSEAKSRADSTDAECAQRKSEAEVEAKRTLDTALREAKELIRATKLKNQQRTEQADARIAEIQAEHDRIAKVAADFKCTLYEVYSNHLIELENIEIPAFFKEEDTPEQAPAPTESEASAAVFESAATHTAVSAEAQENTPPQEPVSTDGEQEPPEPEPQPVQEHGPEIDSEPATENEAEAEQTYVFDGDAIIKAQASGTAKKESKYKPSTFAGIEVQKEHSGQIRYDSSDIESVNKTLDSIIEKKGKSPSDSKKNGTAKLGFLK